jgi:outer membrane receptor for ferrienterochelin and colicin
MKTILLILLLASIPSLLSAQDKGELRGKVLDSQTQSPVEDAVVEILGSGIKTGTNESGEFIFKELQYGSYQVKVSAIGYEPIVKSDLVVYASKPLELTINIEPKGIVTDNIDVEANFFQQSSDVNISSMNLDYEEIRRAPGATEDISRMIQNAPGVSIGNDQRNDIIVRGGSPAENLLMIDGIEVPNINHFGTQGSTSGAIGFINTKFILETDILTGGFPSLYGDKLSGVVNINFREGSRKNFYNDINLSMAGFGGIFEGPISDKGSYMFSARRSYLELIKSSIRLTSVPNYWDFNLKVNYDLTPDDKLTLIGLTGLDKIDFSGETDDDNPYGKSNADQKTVALGFNYKKLLKNGYLEAVLSDSYSDNFIHQFETDSDETRFNSTSKENEVISKLNLNYKLSPNVILNAGIGGRYAMIDNRLFLKGDTNYAGYIYDAIDADIDINTYKLFSHINFTTKLLNDRLIFNTGARVDYFDYIRLKTTFSPRAGVTYRFSGQTALNAAWGIYHQTPMYLWLASHPGNVNLNSIRSDHYVLGLEHFFANDLRGTVEVYEKRYKDYPVWKDIPTYILIDGGSDFGPNLVGEAVSAGRGYVRGFDVSFQKKLSKYGLYGQVTYSYIFSRFRALEGGEKPGAFDPGHQLTVITGYQFKNDWLVGLKFKYSGGRPYTPIDEEASALVGRGVYATDDFNSARYPYYMRVDLRVDKKFNFKSASLVGYIELQNVFNRENIYNYFWNEEKNKLGTIYQWAFFPVGGVSVQF